MANKQLPAEKVVIDAYPKSRVCGIAGTPEKLKALVKDMLDKKNTATQRNGSEIEITLSGMLKCNCKDCKNLYLVGLPDMSGAARSGKKKSAEFRKCTLLEVDPQAAASAISHSNAVEAEKMVEARDKISGDNESPAYVLLETKYREALKEIEKEAKNQPV